MFLKLKTDMKFNDPEKNEMPFRVICLTFPDPVAANTLN